MHSVSLAGILHCTLAKLVSAELQRRNPMPQTLRHSSSNGVSCRLPAPRKNMPPRCPLPRQSHSRSGSCIFMLVTASVTGKVTAGATASGCGRAAKEAGVQGSRQEAAVEAVSSLPV